MDIHTDKETDINDHLQTFSKNKQIPKVLERHTLTALAHYPELRHTSIRFVFRYLNKSVMAARPVVHTLLPFSDKRMYDIIINPVFKLPHSIEPIHQLPDDVLIGWLGHELGHIMDYEEKTVWGIAKFGLLYGLSKRYIRKAERIADTFAVNRGMAPYILSTKEFILGNSDLSPRYKSRIERLYLSPDDIVELVTEMERGTPAEKEEVLAEETKMSKETVN